MKIMEREAFERWCVAGKWKPTESMWAAWEARSLLRSETAAVGAEELKRLRDIEHYVWHVLDDSEEDAATGNISIQPSDDYFKLSELLPEGHP
jgi:hypothetical protein